MPLVRVVVLSDRIAKLLQSDKIETYVEPGTYSLAELISLIPAQTHSLKSIIDKERDTIFIAINGQVRYNLNERIEVRDDLKITVFEVGAGG